MRGLCAIAAVLCFVGSSSAATQNLVPNSSCEFGDAAKSECECWNLWVQYPGAAEAALDAEVRKFGRRSFRVTNRGKGGANTTIRGDIPCQPNTEYTLSVYVRTEQGRGVVVTLGAKDADGKVLAWSLGGSKPVPDTTDWIRVVHTVKTPANCRALTPHLVNNGGISWWDGCQLEVGSKATAYVDSAPPTLPSAAKPVPGANLVHNPGFEQDLAESGWEGITRSGDATGKATWDAAEPHAGKRCVKIESVTTKREWLSGWIPIDPASTYRLSAWLRARELEGRADVYLECYGRWMQPIGRAGYDGGVYAYTDFGWGERYAIIPPAQFPKSTRFVRVLCQVTGTVHATGQAWFDDVRLVMEPCTLTLRPVRPEDAAAQSIFQPGEAIRYEMTAHVPGFANRPLVARVVVRDYFEQECRRMDVPFKCNASDDATVTLDIAGLQPTGYFALTVNVMSGDESLGSQSTSLGVTPFDAAAWAPDERSGFAICHLTNDQMYNLAQIAGMKWTRGGSNPAWHWVERQQGKWNWSSSDRALEREQPFGIHKLIIMHGIAPWASTDPDEFFVFFRRQANKRYMRLPKNLADFENYVYQTVSRYKDRLKYWEIWNEADIAFWHGTDEEYIQLMQAGYRGAKRADKSCLVSMTGLAYPFPGKSRTGRFVDGRALLEKCLKLAPNEFDIVNFHSYGGVKPLERKLREVNELMQQYKCTKPIWITETGMPTHLRGATEQAQARYLLRVYALAFAAGVDKVFWHCFFDWGIDPNYHEHHFGLVHNDYSPKPAYMAYCAMTRMLRNAKPKGEVRVGEGARAVLFERDGKPITVLWAEQEAKTILLKLDGQRGRVTDLMGVTRDLPAQMGLARIDITPDGVYLQDARIVSTAGQPVTMDKGLVLLPGQSRDATLTVHNVLDKRGRWQCKLSCPDGWSVAPADLTFDLAADERGRAGIKLTAPKGLTAAVAMVRCDLRVGSLRLDGLTAGSAALAVPIGAPNEQAKVDGLLPEWPAGLALSATADSRVVHGKRESAADLSARFWIAADRDSLYIAADVRDDWVGNFRRHDQAWVGDAVEFFLDLRSGEALGETRYGPGAYQFFFIPPDERTAEPTWRLWQSDAPFASDVAFACRRGPQGYALEARIPWHNFGSFAPKPGSALGFDFGVDDVDSPQARERKAQLVWAGTERNFVDASHFARGMLTAQPTATRAVAQPAAANLLPNPSFEVDVDCDAAFDHKDGWRHQLADWKDTTGSWQWDRAAGHTGRASLAIRGVTTHRTWESVTIPVANDTAYRASAWIKTAGVDKGLARFYIACFSAAGKWTGNVAASRNVREDGDWRQVHAVVPAGKLPDGTTVVRVNLSLRGETTGTAWFDDVDFRVARE